MKQRWIPLLIILIVIVALIIYLAERGFLQNFTWEQMAIVFAALIGPLKMVVLWFNKNKEDGGKEEELVKDNERLKKELEATQRINNSLKVANSKANTLKKDIELLDANLELLAQKNK